MRRTLVPVALLALVISVGCAAAASPSPAVRFTGLLPVHVSGAHFPAGEEVRVTLRAGTDKRVKDAHVSAAGTFIVGFGTLRKSDRCSGFVAVSAVGSSGARASYRLPLMACTTESVTPTHF
jgi:hypothetical protein